MIAHQETYAIEPIVAALRPAREAKGLSQRALSAATGVPQSHISRIEAGTVNVQLSSLLTLARYLDLEVVLVPRALVPAVEAIKRGHRRETTDDAESTRRAAAELARIRKAARTLSIPDASGALRRLRKEADHLASLPFGPWELETVRQVAQSISHLTSHESAAPRIQEAVLTLKRLRNNLAHRAGPPDAAPRPAYTLDEEDDDA
jgi:transcriptional regulator with XRE-family HTH domain